MRIFCLLLSFACAINFSYSQEASTQRYFIQAMVSDGFAAQNELVSELRDIPHTFAVRYDQITNGLLVVTNEIDFILTEDIFRSWVSEWPDNLYCIRIGLQNVDAHLPFPLLNCGE
jgi:hypothetical protein